MSASDAIAVPMPGPLWGPYPQRPEHHGLRVPVRRARVSGAAARLAALRQAVEQLATLDDAAFDARCTAVRDQLALRGMQPAALQAALALSADAARRALGLRPYDTQLQAALHLLDQRLVEMATGEGKSLATALAAAAAALSGAPVHVLTANDYLVERDAGGFAPLYRRLGLQGDCVLAEMTDERRRTAYAADVVHVTAKELVFDYLRDRQRHPVRFAGQAGLFQRAAALVHPGAEAPVLRGLCVAIVDEADSVLIDEAQMPLILSREQADPAARAYLWQAWQLSGQLQTEHHYRLQPSTREVHLTQDGQARVAELAQLLPAAWRSTRHRDRAVTTALAARHLYQPDRDYVLSTLTDEHGVTTRRVAIVDAVSGRVAEGRRWSRGLHAMVAIKEICQIEPELQTLDHITYQRFFRRYHRLAGLSGTLNEARGELKAMYGLEVVHVAPRRPCLRQVQPPRVFATAQQRWHAVRQRCAELSASGRPVLVGTDSVLDTRALSALLTQAGLAHEVLDARQDCDEAALVERAGRAGAITVATRMAGRGTDIVPDAQALRAGGLHVLCCQMNPSRRQDRQLAGRAARQGQPGSTETWLVLDAARWQTDAAGRVAAGVLRPLAGRPLSRWVAGWAGWCHRAMQHLDEGRHARARAHTFSRDSDIERGLSYAPLS